MNNPYSKYLIDSQGSDEKYLNPRYVAWQEDVKQFVEWLEEWCDISEHFNHPKEFRVLAQLRPVRRRNCPKCREQLRKEMEA